MSTDKIPWPLGLREPPDKFCGLCGKELLSDEWSHLSVGRGGKKTATFCPPCMKIVWATKQGEERDALEINWTCQK